MNIKKWIFMMSVSYALILSLLLSLNAFANKMPWPGRELPFNSGETLHYKLSYRGIFTSMIWADVADAKMIYLENKPTPDKQKGFQFVLQLSTEHYRKAEMIQSVRYTYISTLEASFQRTLLVEEIDTGENQSHDFLWLDWRSKKTQLFKKREKEQINSGFLGLESLSVWEKDGKLPIPGFLKGFPLLENNQTYLIHKESGDAIERMQVLDPLSLIYALRTLSDSIPQEVALAISDNIRLYKIEESGQEELILSGSKYQTTKYKIKTDEKKKNRYYIWLNNDKAKTPLRLSIKAPLGKLKIDLMKITYNGESEQEKSRKIVSKISTTDKT